MTKLSVHLSKRISTSVLYIAHLKLEYPIKQKGCCPSKSLRYDAEIPTLAMSWDNPSVTLARFVAARDTKLLRFAPRSSCVLID